MPLVPAKAGTQLLALDARFRGHERRAVDYFSTFFPVATFSTEPSSRLMR